MNNKSIAKPSIAVVLTLTAALAPAWARPSTFSFLLRRLGAEQTLTGTVGTIQVQGANNQPQGRHPTFLHAHLHALGRSRLCVGDKRCGVRPEWAQKRSRQMAEGAPQSPDASMETLSWSIPYRRWKKQR